MNDATDVLQAIDQLRRDLSGYHGQLKAHNDLQRHCERQKEQLAALQAIHKPIKDERNLYKRQADKLAAENAKLRELVRKYGEFTDQDRCEGCVFKSRCDDGEIDECWQYTEIRELARELGVGD